MPARHESYEYVQAVPFHRFEHTPKRWVAYITRTDGQNFLTILTASARRGFGRVEAIQHASDSDVEMKIVIYEMLVQEENNRQVAAPLTGRVPLA
ncbi:hypothetical protein ACVWW4_006607 [Bradyrhizobium sp. LB7.1]